MAVKFCPLRQGGCLQEDCAWWIRFEGCSVPQLVSVLKDIEGDIDNLTPGGVSPRGLCLVDTLRGMLCPSTGIRFEGHRGGHRQSDARGG